MARGEVGAGGAQRLSRLWEATREAEDGAPVEASSGRAASDEPASDGAAHGWVDGAATSQPELLPRGRHVASGRPRGGPALGAPATAWRFAGVPAGLAAGLLAVAVVVVVAVLLRGAGGGQELLVDAAAAPVASSTADAPPGAAPPGAASSGADPSDAAAAAPGAAPVTLAAPTGPAPPAGGPAGAASATGPVVVHVDGAVHRPGVVTLPAGGRVADAVDAAGGTTDDADTSLVNLARQVVDGELVVVPRQGDEVPTDPAVAGPGSPVGGGSGDGGTAGDALVDVNTADTTALDGLPGIGPVLAERIVSHREQVGPFASVDDLGAVSGIGPAVLEDIRALVTV